MKTVTSAKIKEQKKPKLKTRLAMRAISLCEFTVWMHVLAFSHVEIPLQQDAKLPSFSHLELTGHPVTLSISLPYVPPDFPLLFTAGPSLPGPYVLALLFPVSVPWMPQVNSTQHVYEMDSYLPPLPETLVILNPPLVRVCTPKHLSSALFKGFHTSS